MKHFCILICLIFLFNTNSKSQANTHLLYYELINKAELEIVKSNYSKALELYQTAFNSVEHPFAKDLYNSLLCANNLLEFDIALEISKKILNKGIDIEYIRDNNFTSLFRSSEQWDELEKYYKKNNTKINASFDKNLIGLLDTMLEKDQNSNIERYKDQNLKYIFDSVVYSHAKIHKELFEKKGYPSEEMLGLTSPTRSRLYEVLLLHYFQLNFQYELNDTIELLSILTKAVIDGKMEPRKFIYVINATDNNDYGSNVVFLIDTTIVEINFTNERETQINKNRSEIGFETIEESKIKVEYFIKNILKPTPYIEGENLEEYINRKFEYDEKNFIIGTGLFTSFEFDSREQIKIMIDIYKNTIYDLK